MGRTVLTWVLPAATIVTALACSALPSAPAAGPDDTRTITIRRLGGTTFVSITQGPIEAENPACMSYCERLASCWYAIPNADAMLLEKDVVMACKKEQHGCRTPTTEAFCCGEINACNDFAQCQTESREVAMECSEVRHRPSWLLSSSARHGTRR